MPLTKPARRPRAAGNIEKRMHTLALNQAELSRRARVSGPYLSYLLSGQIRHPRVAVALRIAAALGCSVEELWGRNERGPKP